MTRRHQIASRLLSTVLLLASLVSAVLAQDGPAEAPELKPGAWIGWVYIQDSGDMPLRIWIDEDGSARYDGIPWRSYGWPARLVHPGPGKLGLETTSPKGTEIQMAGIHGSEEWSGHIRTGKFSGAFEMHWAGEDLIERDTAEYEDIAGYYDMDDGDVLVITSRPWGEMLVRSMRTGEIRTMLPTGVDSFVTGSAVYVPMPRGYSYRFSRDEEGHLQGVMRTREGEAHTREGEVHTWGKPFALRSEDLVFESNGVRLSGRITVKDDTDPHDGIVLIGGSDWRERMDHAFHVHSLAALGFSVLSYDKRGFGESGGEDPVSFETSAGDAAAAVRYLRDRVGVSSVGFFGLSRGGWIAPLAANMIDDPSMLILFVPPATSPAVQEQSSRLERMRQGGSSEEDIDLADRTLSACWAFLEDESQWDAYLELAQEAKQRGLPHYILEGEDPDPERWEWARFNMLYDPAPALGKIRAPFLAVFGENDMSVLTPIHEPAMTEALDWTGNEHITIEVISGVGHDLARPSKLPLHRRTGNGAEGYDAVMSFLGR